MLIPTVADWKGCRVGKHRGSDHGESEDDGSESASQDE